MAYSESSALKALSEIRDPRTGRDIVSAGMLADLIFNGGTLRAVLSIDPVLADGFEPVRKSAEDSLAQLDGVETASVILTAHKAAPKLKKPASGKRPVQPHQARRPEGYQGDSQIGTVLAVSSAKGGVGKSTIAVNLAVALAKLGKSVGVLDADIHGPSAPILLGLKGVRAKTEEHQGRRLIKPFSAHGIKAMSIGFLTEDEGPIIWRGPMVQGAISKMLWDVNWGKLDYLIIDMPPGTGDAQLGLAQDIKPKGAIILKIWLSSSVLIAGMLIIYSAKTARNKKPKIWVCHILARPRLIWLFGKVVMLVCLQQRGMRSSPLYLQP